MRTSEQINELAAASAKAQGAMAPAIKDAVNPAYRSRYADHAAVVEAYRGPLAENGLTLWQDVTTDAAGIAVTTRLTHVSGQWVEFGPLVVPLAKMDAHGVGSAISYGKRYAVAAALGIVSEDDDGNAAVAQTPPAKAPTKPAPKPNQPERESFPAPTKPAPTVESKPAQPVTPTEPPVTVLSLRDMKDNYGPYIEASLSDKRHVVTRDSDWTAKLAEAVEENLPVHVAVEQRGPVLVLTGLTVERVL